MVKKPLVKAHELSQTTSPLAQVSRAKDYLNSGNLPDAISLLQAIIPILKGEPSLEYTARLYLGNAFLLQGEYTKAIENYLSSKELANNATALLAVLNNLSLAYHRQGQDLLSEARKSALFDEGRQQQQQQQGEKILLAAKATAQNAVKIAAAAPQSLSTVRSWLNWQKISGNLQPSDYAIQLEILRSLPPSSSKARLLIEMANFTTTAKITTLQFAVETAEASDDLYTLSWAWGALGKLAQERGLFSLAFEHTSLALSTAETILAIDLMYRWQWQLGRIYIALGQTALAQLAYSSAIYSIELIKEDLLIGIRNKQIDFRSEIEPIYRQYLSLLLSQSDYQKAWSISELLAKSELESYFGDDCFTENKLKQQPANVVVIRSIIFEETTYLMLKFPSDEIKVFPIKIAAADLNNLINQWRYQLELPIDNTYRIIGQQLYQLLIQPIVRDLAGVEHLIFINDGLLRTIPLAALYDGREHLIEQYSISYAVSSDLEISKPPNQNLLAFGISDSLNNLPALPQVKNELLAIKQIMSGQVFLNQDFTKTNLEQELSKEYSLLHLATHSSFGGSLENTYLQAYDQNISLLELEQILLDDKFALQLLVLSSCETAIGNEDALLGLAGIGIRTNVVNTIGSMWAVDSSFTVDLLVKFYELYIRENITSSEALRQAQLPLINKQLHPYYWSGFVNIY